MLRHRLHQVIRAYFDAQDFVEVDTAALQVSPGNETHLRAFATALLDPDGSTHRLHLHTSPEFAAKKLLAAGEPRLFTLTHAFRNAERTALHHPEFSLLEWYRAGEPYDAVMQDCVALLHATAAAAGTQRWRFRGREADATATPERLSVADAFLRHAGIDLLATIDGQEGDRDALRIAAGVQSAEHDSWSDIFARVLVEKVEPNLGLGRPTILDRYPLPEAALAQPCADDDRVSERFELYVCGVELANGFGELTDAAEQRRRFEADEERRKALYGESYPIDEDFLAALDAMPAASGVALGVDRLVMLAAGAERIDQVIWTPVVDPARTRS